MKTFGLTGGIGTGKSTVAGLLRRRGLPVVDADQVAREVVAPGSEALAEIAEAFGADCLAADGSLDRGAMRARISQDPQARRRLEAITHPRIFEGTALRLRELAEQGVAVAGVEAALMVETGSWQLYDTLVVVSCPAEVQLARVMARDGATEAAARALITTQLPLADKEAVATHIVRNGGSLEALEAEVEALAAALADLPAQG